MHTRKGASQKDLVRGKTKLILKECKYLGLGASALFENPVFKACMHCSWTWSSVYLTHDSTAEVIRTCCFTLRALNTKAALVSFGF